MLTYQFELTFMTNEPPTMELCKDIIALLPNNIYSCVYDDRYKTKYITITGEQLATSQQTADKVIIQEVLKYYSFKYLPQSI